ncbi:hypothetical protein ACFQY4_23915 [Catellatospora bangladeshensis]|uniref:hypothetical protein n=1 Tax=Catellatospora bangladeshensis TaxID=310355 RepID=UPI003606ACA3
MTGDTGQDGGMELEPFLRTAADLIAVPSTADRPAELHRALDLVLGVVGPGFTVERFESGASRARCCTGPSTARARRSR